MKLTVKFLVKMRVHIGEKAGIWDKSYSSFVFNQRDNVALINIEYSLLGLKRSMAFIERVINSGGNGLFVEKGEYSKYFFNFIKLYNQEVLMGYWKGGFLTNLKKLRKYKNPFKFLYLKKFFKVQKFINFKIPRFVFIMSIKRHFLPLVEAVKFGIPVIGIADTTIRLYGITYLILGNEESITTLKFYFFLVKRAILKGYLVRRLNFKNKFVISKKKV